MQNKTLRGTFHTFGPIDFYSSNGEFYCRFKRFVLFWSNIILFQMKRSNNLKFDYSFWNLISFSFRYGRSPQTTTVTVKCRLTNKPKLGILTATFEFPYSVFYTARFLSDVAYLLERHKTEILFLESKFDLEPWRFVGHNQANRNKQYDNGRWMFMRVVRDRNVRGFDLPSGDVVHII